MNSILKKSGWWLFGASCIGIGLYPIIYFVIDRQFGLLSTKSDFLLNDIIWNSAFYGHIILGGLALLIGWIQFSEPFRNKNLKRHRQIGKVYTIAVLISGICSIYIGFFATGGIISQTGFILLGIIWLSTTILAFQAARNKQIQRHQRLMIYSYAACFAAVTLRIWLPILSALIGTFIIEYRIVAWLCWVPNLIVAYFIARRI